MRHDSLQVLIISILTWEAALARATVSSLAQTTLEMPVRSTARRNPGWGSGSDGAAAPGCESGPNSDFNPTLTLNPDANPDLDPDNLWCFCVSPDICSIFCEVKTLLSVRPLWFQTSCALLVPTCAGSIETQSSRKEAEPE